MFKSILFIYSWLYFFLLLSYLPRLLFQSAFRKKKTEIFHRIRLSVRKGGTGTGKKIWIHAVSVGEVNASLSLIRKLTEEDGCDIFLSTTTVTGRQVAEKALGGSTSIFYFPLDFQFICRDFLRKIDPDLVVIMETEIWPNFLESAYRKKIPVIFLNGRISDKSFHNYLLISSLIKPVFRRIALMCMQSKIDSERIRRIGAPGEILRITGSMKFDYNLEIPEEKERLQERVKNLLKTSPRSRIWICGSTKPNEEEIIASVFKKLKKDFPDLALLLAPRHPNRGGEIAAIFQDQGFKTLRRSQTVNLRPETDRQVEVLILDTVGELAYLYRIADIVFMGGSLVNTGGQNVIEPAFFGKPILFGPSMTNFREIAEIFVSRQAAVQVASPAELEEKLKMLLRDETARVMLGRNARLVLEDNRGAVDRNLEIIHQLLDN